MTDQEDSLETPGLVAIVVVNWNGYKDTASCLKSLESLEYPNYRVIVVDNGSTDGSGDRLAAEFEWCEFVFNDYNEGFGGGCNPGIKAALCGGADYVLLLNPDARIDGNALMELVSVEMKSGAEVVGATIEHEDGTVVNPVPSQHPDMLFYSGYRNGLPMAAEDVDRYGSQRWFNSDRVEGAGVLLTSNLLRERRETVGYYLDDSLFMYCEEIELALWCRQHDKDSVVATEAIVKHDSGASSSRPFQLYYLTRNRVLIAHRYLQGAERVAFDVLFPSTRVAFALRWFRRGQRAVATAVLRGLLDGYRHKGGQTR